MDRHVLFWYSCYSWVLILRWAMWVPGTGTHAWAA